MGHKFVVDDLVHFKEDSPSYPTLDEAEDQALKLSEACPESPVGIWLDDGNDMETVAIVFEGSIWRPDY